MEEITEEDLYHCREDGLIGLAKFLGIEVDENVPEQDCGNAI